MQIWRTWGQHPTVPPLEQVKQDTKFLLLQAANLRRIHIIGCARSGTTMLHYAMVAFADVILYDTESAVWAYPSLRESLALAQRFALPRRRRYLVTKRPYGWFLAEELDRLIYSACKHQLFLINIVRDPRDVLTSYHKQESRDGFYVELDRWQKSIEASEVVLNALQGCRNVLTLRYEDMIYAADHTAALLMNRIGLQLRPNLTSWGNLNENIAMLGQSTSMVQALNSLRNFEASSIGRWRHDPEKCRFIAEILDKSPQQELLHRFMTTYNYSLDKVTPGSYI